MFFLRKNLYYIVLFCLLVGNNSCKHNNFFNTNKQGKKSHAKVTPLTAQSSNTTDDEAEEKLEASIQFAKHDLKMMRDPALGFVPSQRLLSAYQTQQDIIHQANLSVQDIAWQSLGPNNQAGRSRCIMLDKNDATGNTMFAASVSGGLWKCTNINSTNPTWRPVNDFLDNLAITYIAQDGNNPQIMYLCTGETGYGNIDAVRGLGVFKSVNGGITWAQIPATANSNFYQCFKIAVHPNGNILVGTTKGLFTSTNNGVSFTKVLGAGMGIVNAGSNYCYDIDIDNNGIVFATLYSSIHKSTNGGQTFANGPYLPIFAGRIELEVSKADPNYVYALVELNNKVYGILKSINGATTWSSKPEPVDADINIPATDFSRLQAWYDLAIATDPTDKDVVYIGGINIFKSTNGASNWQQISHWYGGYANQYVHADQHMMLFNPTNPHIMYFANDGGVYRTTNRQAAIPTITDIGNNLATTQFYACAIHPQANKNYFLAGAQDNGTHLFTKNTAQSTYQVTGGDGMFCHIDANEPNIQFTAYQFSNINRSTDGGNNWTTFFETGGSFINPTDYDDVNNIMYLSNGAGSIKRWDDAATGNSFTEFILPIDFYFSTISAIKVSPNNPTTVYVGSDDGKLLRITNANSSNPNFTIITNGIPTGFISCIDVEKGNENHLITTLSNYGVASVWRSTNNGNAWQNIEGNLPDMPIRWALINQLQPTQVLLATELGVWSTDNVAATNVNWVITNSNLANVRVNMLQQRTSDGVIIAATHGRGLFLSASFAPPKADFDAQETPIVQLGAPITLTSTSNGATNWLWHFGDGTTATTETATHTYTAAGVYNVSLTINNGSISTVKNSFVQVLPYLSTPYKLANGGNFETNTNHFGMHAIHSGGWFLGKSNIPEKAGTTSGNNAWVTSLTGNYFNNEVSYLYTPSFNFTNTGLYILKFKGKFSFLPEDGFNVEYTTDSGRNWALVNFGMQASWYNNLNNNPYNINAFSLNTPYFTNAANNFTQYSADVAALAGNKAVAFRFVLKTNSTNTSAGAAIDDFEILSTATILAPNTNNSLTAKLTNYGGLLHWQTNTQPILNCVIERSANNQKFTTIATVNNINTNSLQSYTDTALLQQRTNIVWYKVKINYANNTSAYTNTVQLSAKTNNSNGLIITQNPAQQQLLINSSVAINNVYIVNSIGQNIFAKQYNGQTNITIPLQVPAGNYIVIIQTQNGQQQAKKIYLSH
jgi:hypothetical protein